MQLKPCWISFAALVLCSSCGTLKPPPYVPDPCYLSLKGLVVTSDPTKTAPSASCANEVQPKPLVGLDGWVCFDPNDYINWLKDLKQ